MGAIDALRGLVVYFDTNIIIYIVEGYPAQRVVMRDLVRALDDGLFRTLTSEMTLAEVLVGPFRAPNPLYEITYNAVLSGQEKVEVVPVTREILVDAARLRAESRMRLPDAIHVATAARHGCDIFLTNDNRLRPPAGLTIMTLAELAQP
jgi:predicted nucleic acid-binding protein